MRALILSDIHSNLQALEAVLDAAAGQWDALWNLGDTVGYGGSPNQVVERIRPLGTVHVRGNHDRVCCGLTSANTFNPAARAAALWTREALSEDNLHWLRELPRGPLVPPGTDATCAHGSPLDEDHYILTARDAFAPLEQTSQQVCFFGHTHLQGGFARVDGAWREVRPPFLRVESERPATTAQSHTLALVPGSRYLINPGSVGQPRDHNWRAAYAIYDTVAAEVAFHRVPYDLVASQGLILLAGLPERLAMRLREGR